MHTEVDVPNPSHVLIAGMYAEATLSMEHKNSALVVPLQAVDHQGDRTSVMVVTPENKVAERTVTLGLQNARFAEVLTGLSDGEQVVVSDRGALRPGESVQPKTIDLLHYTGQN